MSIKKTYSKILVTTFSTFLLIIYFFMFFTYKNSVISSAILKSSTVAQTIGSLPTSSLSMTEVFNNLNVDTINTFHINSSTKHLILISTSEQMTYIFTGSSNNWLLEKYFVCLTKFTDTETSKGIFTCGIRCDHFFSQKFNKGDKYYIQINNCHYLHSTPFSADENTISEENPSESASCDYIRFSAEDSKWIYDNIQDGSTIVIY